MSVILNCQCGKRLRAKQTLAARHVRCPHCKSAVFVPAEVKSVFASNSTSKDDAILASYIAAGSDSFQASEEPVGLVRQRRPMRDGLSQRGKLILLAVILAVSMICGAALGAVSEWSAAPAISLFTAGLLFLLASLWLVFEKAGLPGWYSLIPLFNLVFLHDIANISQAYCKIYLAPIMIAVLIVVFQDAQITGILLPFLLLSHLAVTCLMAVVCYGVACNFGHGFLFALGLFFFGFIFYPILGFGNSRCIA